ncbi:MAG TPA: FliM/FliN family flagellar motor C-terminal domain-containing protein [Rhizomicrobium sp.]|nr:FliM/FliN family flagellar motor C-terminal domain-containing protein [Rhizomicrobium sp.]
MSTKEWLPGDAFTTETIRPAVAGVIATWSNRWFRNAQVEIDGVRPAGVKSRIAQSLCVHGAATEAELPGRGKRALLEAALNTDLSGLTLSASDHEILDAFASEAIKDLLSMLDSLGNGGEDDQQLSVSLSLAGSRMMDVILSSQALVPAMKAAMGRTRWSNHAPKMPIEALKPVKLTVEGFLGRAEVTLDDLKGLAIGDVVMLDNALKSPVELRLHATGQRIGRGKLTRTDDKVSIQL